MTCGVIVILRRLKYDKKYGAEQVKIEDYH